ncbi:hypothetical protein OCJ37_05760 [Xanthomonas sp. AM6]|uniref:hypothetical protein n=1 Tax=Xanthomonas sp. AM6 TaxID=2982531 RepID=UPI0021D9CDC9|nr:hypothetical protein [Xanthomonas sp. AM6]UYB53452.1 hypothetical protein OCJ37_05760 [Xanthomonas sp. AM6]
MLRFFALGVAFLSWVIFDWYFFRIIERWLFPMGGVLDVLSFIIPIIAFRFIYGFIAGVFFTLVIFRLKIFSARWILFYFLILYFLGKFFFTEIWFAHDLISRALVAGPYIIFFAGYLVAGPVFRNFFNGAQKNIG